MGKLKLNTHLVIAIPTTSEARMSLTWMEATTGMSMPLGTSAARFWSKEMSIAEARNQLCKRALDIGAEYIVFIGDDVIVPPNTVISMLEKIGRSYHVEGNMLKADMITGIYWTKGYPSMPYLWNGALKGPHLDWKVGDFFPVDLAGCDCLMIRCEVLRHMPYPWFSTDWTWEEGQKVSSLTTEDFYFFTKARQHGFRLFADTSIQCSHEDRASGMLFGLTTDMPQAGGMPDTDEGEYLVAEIASGYWSPAYGRNTKVIRFDIDSATKPDVQCDVLSIPEWWHGKFDIAHASHILEHLPRDQAKEAVGHWLKLLKVGGTIKIRVPNIAYPMKRILAMEEGKGHVGQYDWAQIYGLQQTGGNPDDWQVHRNGFTKRKLEALLKSFACLGNIEVTETETDQTDDGSGLNLMAKATLVKSLDPEVLLDKWDEIWKREGIPLPKNVMVGSVEQVEEVK